jgi:hypothetical protein
MRDLTLIPSPYTTVMEYMCQFVHEELDDYAVSALQRVIAEVRQSWSVIGWVTKNLLSRAPSCLGRHVKPLVPAAFAVVSINPQWARLVGYGPFSLCVIHKEAHTGLLVFPAVGRVPRL